MNNPNSKYFYIFYSIFFFNITIIQTQNFNYQEDDWLLFTKSSSINSIIETSDNVLFGTNKGIYKQNKFTKEISYDFYNSQELRSKTIHHILYDKNTDYYWVVHDYGISYKASISKYWRDIDFSEIKLNSFLQIEKIGFNSEAIWIQSNFGLISIDRFNSKIINIDIISEINWNSSKINFKSQIDILKYNFSNEWHITSEKIINRKSNLEYRPIVKFENNFGETWIGTDLGMIFYGQYNWLESSYIGIPQNRLTEIYLDQENIWWFAESRIKSNIFDDNFQTSFIREPEIFLSSWDENNNRWSYFFSNESVSIKNTDINKIIRYNNKIYLGTMNGLLILDLISREWTNINKGLNDIAIWDLVILDELMYIATARGINRMSINHNIILPNSDILLEYFTNKEIYKLIIYDQELYVMSDLGLSKINFFKKKVDHLSKRLIRDFEIQNNEIFINDGKLWKLIQNNNLLNEELSSLKGNDFCISNDFIWTFFNNNATLIDLNKKTEWNYSNKDGIYGDIIYSIDCDEEWVWFGTNNGISFYNWNKFHR